MNLNEEQVIALELTDNDLKTVVGGWGGEHDDDDWGHHRWHHDDDNWGYHRWRHHDWEGGGYPFFCYPEPSYYGRPSFEGGPSYYGGPRCDW
ncbi:MAG: hypothetical protein H0V70_20235 [Ktedonobacteraceae bacterium]|nr:hypothetical protein [Ktedonobacteraceae bacterium]